MVFDLIAQDADGRGRRGRWCGRGGELVEADGQFAAGGMMSPEVVRASRMRAEASSSARA